SSDELRRHRESEPAPVLAETPPAVLQQSADLAEPEVLALVDPAPAAPGPDIRAEVPAAPPSKPADVGAALTPDRSLDATPAPK
ncbi:MAG: hypothetical protein ACWA5A_04620, partial [Marinibacterium sp.]